MSMDFIGFTYNGKHSFRDLHIYRTSNGSRYNDNLNAALTDKTADVPGGDGQYYFGTTHKNKTFSVSYAFDNLTESGLRLLKQTFDGKDIHDLIFDEEPYKVWSAKVTGTAQIKHLCFEESEGQRTYKGEGSITFTCYYPYAHTPNKKQNTSKYTTPKPNTNIKCGLIIPPNINFKFNNAGGYQIEYWVLQENGWIKSPNTASIATTDKNYYCFIENLKFTKSPTSEMSITINEKSYIPTDKGCFECKDITDGRDINYYSIIDYPNKREWVQTAELSAFPKQGENFGDIPTTFVYSREGGIFLEGDELTIGEESIIFQEPCVDIKWDSKTGIILGKPLTRTNDGYEEDLERPIRYTGNSLITIPVGAFLSIPAEGTLTYNYWYY